MKKTYLHYLFAGIGSAVIVSIYSIVDAIMVGQYEGYNGTAALSVVMPIWTIILSLGLLFGVGGGSLMSKARGEGNERRGREFFTCALVCVSGRRACRMGFADLLAKRPFCGCLARTTPFCPWQRDILNG